MNKVLGVVIAIVGILAGPVISHVCDIHNMVMLAFVGFVCGGLGGAVGTIVFHTDKK